ncbi:MAG: hypothetical protein ACI9XK_005059, partial [Granulosicoccus sp.]
SCSSRRLRTLKDTTTDIMESFDDDRSAAAFEVLTAVAIKGQVLYLTDQQHLIPITQQVLGAANIHVLYLEQ